MGRYRSTNCLSRDEAAYIAGLIDGEGSIGLLRKHKDDYRQLVVSISNNELDLLRYIRDTVGAGQITNKSNRALHHAKSYAYTICNRQALTLLEQTTCFLRTYKADRARLILDRYVELTPRNGKYSEGKLQERNNFIALCMSINATSRSTKAIN